MKTFIPFQGFYQSIHDDQIDYALESLFKSDDGSGEDSPLANHIHLHCDYQAIHTGYAKGYAENFSQLVGIKLQFSELISPTYYNFETDRILCTISTEDVLKMVEATPVATLDKVIKERFTSRSGFISFYPNSIDSWPVDVTTWDSNQVETLLMAYLESTHPDFEEISVMEDSHEYIYHLAVSSENKEFHRLLDIQEYLRQRAER